MATSETLVALVETQLRALAPPPAPLLDDPSAVAAEVAALVARMPPLVRFAFHETLDLVATTAVLRTARSFEDLTVDERTGVIESLEHSEPWDQLSQIAEGLVWLVVHSRPAARALLGFKMPDAPVVDVPEPAGPSLDEEYDVCVIGSGAGGSVVAARLAAEGKRVLVLEAGAWVNPKDLSTRDDRALIDLYKDGGAQPGFPTLDRVLRPAGVAMVNVLQAEVVGGGPMVNNAIHLPIAEETWRRWRDDHGFPIPWAPLQEALIRVHDEVGVNVDSVVRASGDRARVFQDGALALSKLVQELPLSLFECIGCGGCNVGCRFGKKTGALHGPRPANAPRSHLERALAAGARVATRIEARGLSHLLSSRVRSLAVRDRRDGSERAVRAKAYVIAAGPVASSRILHRSGVGVPFFGPPIGRGLSANVVSPVTALFADPVAKDPARPDPGIQICYFVDGGGALLETYFHYPGSLAVALPKGMREHARVMRQYGRTSMCGVVVPTTNAGAVDDQGKIQLSLSDSELARMKAGIEQIADVFLEAGATEVFPATRHAVSIRRATRAADVQRMRESLRGPGDLALATPHPQGGNALASGAKGVVGEDFRVRGLENAFVADASLFPNACGVNPQSTVMALAHLAADRVLDSLG